MKVTNVETKEQYVTELTIEVDQETFEAGLENAFRKSRSKITVPGFRKGKAPRKVIEGMYGASVFYEDAVEELYPEAFQQAVEEQALEIVAAPKIEIVKLDKDGFTFKAAVTVCPEVTLKQYKGLTAEKPLPVVTDADVDQEMKQYIEKATRIETVDRPAELGDIAVIDYEGFDNGVPFPGGKGEKHELELGSGSFIPGFEEQVVGMSAGEEKEFEITFPEDYHANDLAGKTVVFKVKVTDVKEKIEPVLDDEFAKDVSEFDTLADFKTDLRSKISDRRMSQAEVMVRKSLMDQINKQVEIELPEAMVESQIDRTLEDYRARLGQQGISLEMYLQYMQMSMDGLREQIKPNAESQIRDELALDAIVKAENIVASEEEVDQELKKISETMNIPLDDVMTKVPRDKFKDDIAREKAITLLVANAEIKLVDPTEPKVEEVTKDDETEEKAEEKPKKTKKSAKAAAESGDAEEAAAPKKRTRKPTKKEEPEEGSKE